MSTVKTERRGPTGVIRFDNPPHNFMTSEMVRDLDQVTREWERDPGVRSIVLTSALPGIFITHYAKTAQIVRKRARGPTGQYSLWAPSGVAVRSTIARGT